ncbi:MAG: hypothetical protein ACI9W4_000193 [Rhodothermales bacterium]|jgi:hypothetical protein
MVRSIFLALIALFLVPTAQAQASQLGPVLVSGVAEGPDDPDQALNRTVIEALQAEFLLRGYPSAGYGLRLHARAEALATSEGKQVILSIVEGSGLRENSVEAGAQNQIWYAGTELPEDLEEGKMVREYMTREVLENLVSVHGIRILVFDQAGLGREIARYVDEVEARMNCQTPQGCS